MAKAVESDEYLNERVDRAIAEALDKVLMLAITDALPEALPKVLPTVLPKTPDPVAKPEPMPAKVSVNRTAQQESIERLQEAILRRLTTLPHDWRKVVASRETGGGVRVEVVFY